MKEVRGDLLMVAVLVIMMVLVAYGVIWFATTAINAWIQPWL